MAGDLVQFFTLEFLGHLGALTYLFKKAGFILTKVKKAALIISICFYGIASLGVTITRDAARMTKLLVDLKNCSDLR